MDGHSQTAEHHVRLLLQVRDDARKFLTDSFVSSQVCVIHQHTALTLNLILQHNNTRALLITDMGTLSVEQKTSFIKIVLTLSNRWSLEVKYFSNTLIFSTLGALSMKPAYVRKKYSTHTKKNRH